MATGFAVSTHLHAVKADALLRANVQALLTARKETQAALGIWLSLDKSHISKFLQGKRELQLHQLDRLADFFGVEAYQLFQPGISAFTERRKAQRDRRTGRERRLSREQRLSQLLESRLRRTDTPLRPRYASAISGAPPAGGLDADVAALVARNQDLETRLTATQAELAHVEAERRRLNDAFGAAGRTVAELTHGEPTTSGHRPARPRGPAEPAARPKVR